MKDNKISGFNTALQNVEERYSWVNDMINERKQLVLRESQELCVLFFQ